MPVYTVHKDFMQAGPVYGHEEYFGLTEREARAKYHQLLAAAYTASDPWTHVFIAADDGRIVAGELVDRRETEE